MGEVKLKVEIKVPGISTHEVILVEKPEEGLSFKVWMVAIGLAVTVTVSLLAIILVVCLRYRCVCLLPNGLPREATESEQDSSSSSSSSCKKQLISHHWSSACSQPTSSQSSVSSSQTPMYTRVDT